MVGSVIFRSGHKVVDGIIVHNDRDMSWFEADKRAGFRLNRRKSWAFIPQHDALGIPELCSKVTFGRACYDCIDEEPYQVLSKGRGCSSCGYSGRVREAYFVPFSRGGRG